PPLVPLQGTTANTGGTIPGGKTYWVKIASKDTTGSTFGLSAPSNIVKITVPAGTNTNTITVPSIYWPSGAVGYVIFAGADPNSLSRQAMADSTPSSITLTAYKVSDYGEPDIEFDHVEVDVYKTVKAGVCLFEIDSVTATTIKAVNPQWTTDQWAGY